MNHNLKFKNGLNKIIKIISNEKKESIKFTSLAIKVLQNLIEDLIKRIINQSKQYSSNILTPSNIQKSILNQVFYECPELSNVISLQCMTCISRVSSILENNNNNNKNNKEKINLNNLAGLNLSISYILSIIKSIDMDIKIVNLSPIIITAICDSILFEICELSSMEFLINNNAINSNTLILSIKKDQELSRVLNIKKENSSGYQEINNNNNSDGSYESDNQNNQYMEEDYFSDQDNIEEFDFEVKDQQ